MEKRKPDDIFLELGLEVSHVVDKHPHGRAGSFTEKAMSKV